jgi:nitrogen-specific signal transduction histidine kinase/CheY-like chemotaxis protein
MQVAFDNTERKENELKLLQAQKMEAIGLLAGGVAHDFNNILSVILGYATMARDELGESNPRVKRDILQIEKAGLRAKDLAKQILTFCHQSEEHFQPLKLPLIIKEVIKMVRSSFPATIRITARISVTDPMVVADPSQIHQVLLNLCTNALHAMKDGGELTIGLQQVNLEEEQRQRQLQELPPGPYLRLSVSDTGLGITEDIQGKIFDPFFTTKVEGEGTGLGLAVVQGIITNHKGAITVDSAPGKGATFSVYLPEVTAEATETKDAGNQKLPCGEETIMVIDDEPAVAMIMQRLLQTLGYTVEAFTDSAQAFEAYSSEPTAFDLVITDMTMPKFTGMTLSRAMLGLRPDQAIIICTGYSDAIDEVNAKAEGVGGFLDKPVSRDTLARTVRLILDRDKEENPAHAGVLTSFVYSDNFL